MNQREKVHNGRSAGPEAGLKCIPQARGHGAFIRTQASNEATCGAGHVWEWFMIYLVAIQKFLAHGLRLSPTYIYICIYMYRIKLYIHTYVCVCAHVCTYLYVYIYNISVYTKGNIYNLLHNYQAKGL